jgi:phosphoenolpyruvate carboxykinase (ATP)
MILPSTPAIATKNPVIAGLPVHQKMHYQLPPEQLIRQTTDRGEGALTDTGALVVSTGLFTGRSPEDKFIVKDQLTSETVDWNHFNTPIEPVYFDQLYNKMLRYLTGKEIWVRDCFACADEAYRINIRVINENPWSNLFAYNMFLQPAAAETNSAPDWHIFHAPEFKADPKTDGTRHGNFTIVDFTKKIILIGGSAYTGEIKKGIFSVLNFLLPVYQKVLSMHCAANVGKKGDTALFFGLSGTGKTTLSADPERCLIGDDEHGWTSSNIFNFEGGCYAKTIDLSEAKEPEICHPNRCISRKRVVFKRQQHAGFWQQANNPKYPGKLSALFYQQRTQKKRGYHPIQYFLFNL